MIRSRITDVTSLNINESYDGETLETKLERVTNNNEAISDGSPPIYTERKFGVLPEYNIRADKWDLAIDAMDTATKLQLTKREESIKAREEAKVVKINDGKAEPIQGTENK